MSFTPNSEDGSLLLYNHNPVSDNNILGIGDIEVEGLNHDNKLAKWWGKYTWVDFSQLPDFDNKDDKYIDHSESELDDSDLLCPDESLERDITWIELKLGYTGLWHSRYEEYIVMDWMELWAEKVE